MVYLLAGQIHHEGNKEAYRSEFLFLLGPWDGTAAGPSSVRDPHFVADIQGYTPSTWRLQNHVKFIFDDVVSSIQRT